MYGHVTGDDQKTVREIIVDGVNSINPQWVLWRKLDCFVVSCLNATFTPSVSGDVLGLTSAREIWVFLDTSFRK